LRDFLATHVFSHLSAGPKAFTLVSPAPKASTTTTPTLTWNTSSGATSWLVEVGLDGSLDTPVFTAPVFRGPSLAQHQRVQVARALLSAHSYRWRVTARNDFGTVTAPAQNFHVK